MKFVAIIALRNEEAYIGRCLDHLFSQNIEFYIIDNESTDATAQIVERYRGRGLIGVARYRYVEVYDWVGLLRFKEEIAATLDADWIIHQDADEILESPFPTQTLAAALEEVDRAGYNAVNFDEFCFIPTSEDESYVGRDYVSLMRNYFFFEPVPMRLIRAWRRDSGARLADSGGHAADFAGRKIWPRNFVLRHYIGLSMDYLRRKYVRNRIYSPSEVKERGWHGWRASVKDENIRLVDSSALCELGFDGKWDKARPYSKHPFVKE